MNGTKSDLEALYGEESVRARKHYEHLREKYTEGFGAAELRFFSSPGRTETIGDHTDRNGGKILMGSITPDTVCAAVPTNDGVITIVSEGYRPVSVNTKVLAETTKKGGSKSLVTGIAEAAGQFGYKAGSFHAYVTSEIIATAGALNSASFEMPVCAILDVFYNNGRMSITNYARMGQHVENHWWNETSGLMDQMIYATGGVIFLDFSEGVHYETIDFSFEKCGLDLFIVNTGKGHADLTEEHPTTPQKVYTVAEELGGNHLTGVRELIPLMTFSGVREKLGNDRTLFRALHFFEEEKHVDETREAATDGDSGRLLRLMGESGKSSYERLQDAYYTENPEEQPIPLALCPTELFLGCYAHGTRRIHGDGSVDVTMAILSHEEREDYVAFLSQYFGKESIYHMDLRRFGAVKVDF